LLFFLLDRQITLRLRFVLRVIGCVGMIASETLLLCLTNCCSFCACFG